MASSKYLERIENKGDVASTVLNTYLESHWLDVTYCRNDDFDNFIIRRAGKLLDAIEIAMGKTISGRDGEEVVKEFGDKLS